MGEMTSWQIGQKNSAGRDDGARRTSVEKPMPTQQYRGGSLEYGQQCLLALLALLQLLGIYSAAV